MTMKALRASDGAVFGPFAAITMNADHFACDGVLYPRAVVGAATIQDWLAPPLAPPPPPATITKLQLTLGLVASGLISAAEGEAMAEGSGLPALIAAAIASLPAGQRLEARIRFKGMTEVERANPLIDAVGWIGAGRTPAQMDALFLEWSLL